MFWRAKDSMKRKCYFFSGYKQRKNMCLVYLEWKLQQDRYRWCIFKLKYHKTVEKAYLHRRKQQTAHRWFFWMLKSLRKTKYCVFELLPTNKQGWVYVFSVYKPKNNQ